MMPTVGRLKTRPQFLKVAAAKHKWAAPGLVLQAARRQCGESRAAPDLPEKLSEAPDEPAVRIGFTVTRRVGNAVVRNRAKRRLRAAAAEVFPQFGLSGTDYVVIGRLGTLKRPYGALLKDLEQAIVKLNRRTAGKGAAQESKGGIT
ncbi:ribonuclease P protein component [Pelagibius litoralis]|uniref:Ribonuclease P protein component n=1 Tax=Pelagibius litoralis TaxID=374515 RepID=A0A967KBT6_9PROT|nr:ribonuclease P protein component [Pelagibius litoralis]NIA71277.1 ribonuclease P protein component [Pelagibius litoralis]